MTEKEIIYELKKLFNLSFGESFHHEEIEVAALPQAGSDRRYFRMGTKEQGIRCIGTYSPDPTEGDCFIRLTNAFRASGNPVPEIYGCSSDHRFYLQEDLGDTSLFSLLNTEDGEHLVKETLLRLVRLQKTPKKYWVDACSQSEFNWRQVMWDLNYFKYEYLKQRNVIFDEYLLEDDFERMAERLVSISEEFKGFMMRDCQSRNIMVTESGPCFIDYQGGRLGPVLYDAVAFLWQARAGFSREFRRKMVDCYAEAYCGDVAAKKEMMLSYLPDMVLFRTLQVLGAYGYRGLVQKRSHFLQSIPGALHNLGELLDERVLSQYPELERISDMLVNDDQFCRLTGVDDGRLEVEVYSFSYKKGYPEDSSGNGGGFMFDCRALHNPGRYKEYKSLTGRDKEVVEFLESRGEVEFFLRNAWAMTDAAVERYISRKFTHLQIGFGCTGGQHRSVYCAEKTANHMRNLFPDAKIILVHMEHPAETKEKDYQK